LTGYSTIVKTNVAATNSTTIDMTVTLSSTLNTADTGWLDGFGIIAFDAEIY